MLLSSKTAQMYLTINIFVRFHFFITTSSLLIHLSEESLHSLGASNHYKRNLFLYELQQN